MRIVFSFLRNDKVHNVKFEGDTIKIVIRRLRNYICDQEDINEENWIGGQIYDNDSYIGEIDVYGNINKKL